MENRPFGFPPEIACHVSVILFVIFFFLPSLLAVTIYFIVIYVDNLFRRAVLPAAMRSRRMAIHSRDAPVLPAARGAF